MSYFGWGLEASPRLPSPPFTINTFLSKIGTIFSRPGMSQTKHCKGCSRELPLERFNRDRTNKDGRTFYCKDCTSKQGKTYRTKLLKDPHRIYKQTCANQKYYKHKEVEIPEELFVTWYVNEPKRCAYCDIEEEDTELLREFFSGRALRLTVDCKDNMKGYVENNLVLACGVCNLLKNNFFSYEEFRDVAQRYVKPKWIKIKSKEGKQDD